LEGEAKFARRVTSNGIGNIFGSIPRHVLEGIIGGVHESISTVKSRVVRECTVQWIVKQAG
jgi:hypothetical protein